MTVGAPGGGLPARAPPLQELLWQRLEDAPAGGRGAIPAPFPAPPPGLRQDGGTPRLLPGGPCAPGRAAPRSLLTGPAEVGVAGLQRAPLLQEREYLPTPPPPRPWRGRGSGNRRSKGTSHFCRQETVSGRPREGLAQVAGVWVPPAGPSSCSELRVTACLLIHHLLSACCLLSMVVHWDYILSRDRPCRLSRPYNRRTCS